MSITMEEPSWILPEKDINAQPPCPAAKRVELTINSCDPSVSALNVQL